MESIKGTNRSWRRPEENHVVSTSSMLEKELAKIERMTNPDFDAYLASLPEDKHLILKQNLVRVIISAISLGLPAIYFLKQIS